VKLLLDAGSDINAYDKEGKTAFLYTLEEGRKPMRDLLLERGADVNYAERDDNFGALMRAADWGDEDLTKLLISKGANVNSAGLWDKKTSLMRAAIGNRLGLLRILCEAGATLDLTHNDGKSAMMLAAEEGNVEIVKELLERGADVTIKSGWRHDGPTAEGLAEDAGKANVVALFKEHAKKSK